MIAGGLGTISDGQTKKKAFAAGTLLVQLGGPGMRIGMGGGAASSMAAGTNTAALDFDSVQRGNPEIQRRAQEVINHCWALGDSNPILAIHDVGAGGISNAFPELVDGAGRGAHLRPAARCRWRRAAWRPRRSGATRARSATSWRSIRTCCRCSSRCARASAARLPSSASPAEPPTGARRRPGRRARDRHADGGAARQAAEDAPRRAARARNEPPLQLTGVKLEQVAFDVLRHPTVASKRFLVTIGDRTVGGLSHRDPMVGPWQVPVADCAVTLADYRAFAARRWRWASARRWPRSMRRPRAAWRWARPSPTCWRHRSSWRASSSAANWMAACGEPGEDAALYDTVQGGRHGAVPGPGHRHPGGQGFAVDAHALERRQRRQASHGAGVADRHRLRHAGRRARHADAAAAAWRHHADPDRPRRRAHAHGGLDAGAGAGPVRRPDVDGVPDLDDAQLLKSLVAADQPASRAEPACWPTTTAATAACGRRCARWPLPATAA